MHRTAENVIALRQIPICHHTVFSLLFSHHLLVSGRIHPSPTVIPHPLPPLHPRPAHPSYLTPTQRGVLHSFGGNCHLPPSCLGFRNPTIFDLNMGILEKCENIVPQLSAKFAMIVLKNDNCPLVRMV